MRQCPAGFLSPEELPESGEVFCKKTRSERVREFGGVWLGNNLFDKLGLDRYFAEGFRQHGEDPSWLIKILIISRFYCPSSELHIAEHFYEHSAMEDFFGIPAQRVYDNCLYRGLDKLLPLKEELQQHLKERMGELFAIDYLVLV